MDKSGNSAQSVEIKIEGKGTVKITYDADGAKLKREFLNSTTSATKITWYLGEYQYEEVTGGPAPRSFAVEFISFGEGRIRPITPRNESNTYDALQLDGNLTLPNGKKGSIDYFISDHRTDVRMILSEEKQWSYTTASMETASSRNTVEEGLFSTLVSQSRAPKTEVPGWTANTSQYVSKLNSTRPVGPNQLLKVMAGDLLHANVQYYYQQVATNSSGSTVFSSVLSMLGSSITGTAVTSAATKAASTGIISNLNTGLPFSQVISPDITSSAGNLPKAYLNVVFFDERFNFVSESSTSVRVGAANAAANLALTQIKAPENGYCYVYISNESTVSVYFDNLQVRHDRGRIVEENHYYAYGLRINAISSKAYGGPANNYLYQGDFAELDEDVGWTDFMLRSYDAEIGRFLQNDPYDEFASGYVGMGGDPINLIDPTGGCVYCETAEKAMTFSEVFVVATKKANTAAKTISTVSKIATITNTALRVADVAADFTPFLGSGKDIYQGARDGDWLQLGMGVVGLAADIFTLGGASIVKGTVKTGVKAVVKSGTKTIAKNTVDEGSERVVKRLVRKSPCGCFVAGTLILTTNGTKPIEEIAVGDVVWSYNDTTGTYDRKKVKTLFQYERDSVYQIKIVGEVIIATSDHPFYIGGHWLKVNELKPGDSVQVFDGSRIVIEQISVVRQRRIVYNFEVEDYHTYFVSNTKILVHNSGPCDKIALSSTDKRLLRDDARKIWKQKTGKAAFSDGMDVHHRIPLEWDHLMAGHPNRISNLVGVKSDIHQKFITPAWNKWRESLKGRIPSQSEIMEQALKIDNTYSQFMKFIK